MGRGRVCVVVLAGTLAAAVASAHGVRPAAVRAVLDAPPAALAGMRVQLHETLGTQLVLENRTPRTVEILDETGVPFARIGPRGVEANLAAAAWYRTLGPAAPVPPHIEDAAPRWVRASAEPSLGWFDPRLVAPEGERAQPGDAFEIPLRVDDERTALSGRFVAKLPPAGRYAARLTSPSELAPGVRVTLLPGSAAGLLVHNETPEALLVFGARGEPFLRIGPQGVEANLRSATWQRSARTRVEPAPPGDAETALVAAAEPLWQRVASAPRFGWIEPRAAVEGPPAEAARSEAPSDVAWQVPMQLGERRLHVTGVVAWKPLPAPSR